MFHHRRTLPLAVAAGALLSVPSGALADRAAIRSERVELRAAVKQSKLVPKPVRHGSFKLRRARISTEGRWALSNVVPTGGARGSLDAVVGLFQSRASRWRLVQVGTAGVGCGKLIVPRDVRRDLGIRCSAG